MDLPFRLSGSSPIPVVFIVGPTGSGKSVLALELARRLNGAVINLDARQVFQNAVIGTASPAPAEISQAPHLLYNFLPPTQVYSAGAHQHRVDTAVRKTIQAGRLPILVGGTGLYFRAARYGLIPAGPAAEIRRKWEARAAEQGWARLYSYLKRADPVAAARIHPRDRGRILRALEIYEATGVRPSEIRRRHGWRTRRYADLVLGLMPPKPVLRARIHERTRHLWEQGWPEEVRRLLVAGVPRNAPVFDAIGYREIADWLTGDSPHKTPDLLLESLRRRTVQYARRQWKWFRREPGVRWWVHPPPPGVLTGLVRFHWKPDGPPHGPFPAVPTPESS